jgi:hypothetical protein
MTGSDDYYYYYYYYFGELIGVALARRYGRYGIKAMWLDETEPDRTGATDARLRQGGWTYVCSCRLFAE